MGKDLYTRKEFAERIHCTPHTLSRWHKTGKFVGYETATGKVFYTEQHYFTYLREIHQITPPPTPPRGKLRIYERERAMYEMRCTGVSLREVGKRYGVSHERVRQIVKRYAEEQALPPTPRSSRTKKTRAHIPPTAEQIAMRHAQHYARPDVPVEIALDAHLVGAFLQRLRCGTLRYRYQARYATRKDGTPSPHANTPTSVCLPHLRGATQFLHRWVLEQYGIPLDGMVIFHRDGNICNNMYENLTFLTRNAMTRIHHRRKQLSDEQETALRAAYAAQPHTSIAALARQFSISYIVAYRLLRS